MITKIHSTNYKAFDDFELELKPITILLGANSCGKSAIINSLLMLSQTCESINMSDSPLRLNGKRVGMGEPLNIIKDKNPKKKLTFNLQIPISNDLRRSISALSNDLIDFHVNMANVLTRVYGEDNRLNKYNRFRREFLGGIYFQADKSDKDFLKKLNSYLKKIISLYREEPKKLKNKRRGMYGEIYNYLDNIPLSQIEHCLSEIVTIPPGKLCATNVEYQFSYKKDNFEISQLTLKNSSSDVIARIENNGKLKLNSDIIKDNLIYKAKKAFFEIIDTKAFNPIKIDNTTRSTISFIRKLNNPLSYFLAMTIKLSIDNLISKLIDNSVNHVTPLRAFPQRYYLLDKSIHHEKLDSSSGTELAEVLKNNPKILDEINKYLIEFNIQINIDKVNDIIHKIVVNQNSSIKLELTDVGFGISQVLPILVQALISPEGSLTIIEQPEIHLHPKMQAWLTDALVNIALNGNKKFLIETHSDTIIRRLRLRIVDPKSKLNSDNVSICHLERNYEKKCSELTNVKINEKGEIKYPDGFMDVEMKDTIAIFEMNLKNENNKEVH